jgi:DNA-binding beta-propeller fold protein YncE
MRREGRPRSTLALLVTIVLVVSVVALVASTRQVAAPTSTTSATASTPQGSETTATSQPSSSPTVSATSQTSASSTVLRIPDTESTYAANVSGTVTTLTGTNTTASNCPPMGGAQMELQVVSDTTGKPVQQGAPAVSAVYQTGCHGIDVDATDTLYFEGVSEGSSGWFDLPSMLGAFNFTVGYSGQTYSFRGNTDPASTTCATLAVPSGTVTMTTYQFSNYDCAGNLGGWAANATYRCFGEVYLRVLSDSDSALVPGAAVTTAYDFPLTCAPSFFESPSSYLSSFSGEAFKSFTTGTSTEWYAFGDAANSFSVIYGGQAYNVTASQRAGSTCVTLRVPSGAVDTTYGAGCATGSSTSTLQSSTTSSSTSTTTSATSSSTTSRSASSSSTALSTGSSPSILAAEVANVTLTPWPGQIAVNPVTGKVYVSDLFANTLTVLNASNYEIIRNITLPGTPSSGIAIDTELDMVYVPVSGCTNLPNARNSCNSPGGEQSPGSIIRIDGQNDTIVGEFPIAVQRLAVDQTRQVLYGISTGYVSSLGVDYLISYDENSGALLSDKPLNATLLDMAVNSQSNMVYLSACGQLSLACENAQVLAVNESSYLVQWTAPLGYDAINFPLVFDSANHSVYVMGETGANLTLDAFDGLTGNLLYSASLGSSCAGAGGGGMVVDTTLDRLYVVSDSENFLLVVDGGNGTLVGTFNTPQSGGEYNIGLNPATGEVYLTLESSSHPDTGYFVVLSVEGLDRTSQVAPGFLQRGVCVP